MASVTAAADALATGRRLVIKDLEVENFKSYAGRHRIGPFHKTFTAVIGPNGSGKSNVIDAMLFVFGKSAKKIRLEKLSELIHSSAAHPHHPFASVTVNFVEIEDDADDDNQWCEIPGTAVAVRREVSRNNASQYFIDGRRMPQKDVVAFLVGRGVDLEHNRFLILQGEVEQIAMMKPKGEKDGEEGLLEYFDDLIGTNSYVGAIDAAAARAEQCQEQRLGCLDTVNRLRQEREALRAGRDSTMDFVSKDNELQRLVSVLCQKRIQTFEAELVEPRRQVAAIDAETAAVEERRAAAQAEHDEVAAEAAEARAGHIAAEKAKAVAEAQRQRCDEERAERKADVDQAEKRRKKEADALKKHGDEVRRLELQIADAERDRKLAEGCLEEADERLAAAAPRLEQLREAVEAEIQPLRHERDRLQRAAAPAALAAERARNGLKVRRQELDNATAGRRAKEAQLAEARGRAAQLQGEMAAVQDELGRNADAGRDYAAERTALRQEVEGAARRMLLVNARISQRKDEVRSSESDDRVVKFLVAQADLPGYYGTLRQLGRIDEQYDVAAGVAGGQAWGHHVVESEEVATRCLRLLREQNLRASFMPLSKVGRVIEAEMEAKFTPPPGSHRLFDLITCDAKFAPAFFHAVRNTLVTDSLQAARRIGLGGGQRHRVATLGGELVEKSGVMSGGGSERPPGAKLRGAHAALDRDAVRQELGELQRQLLAASGEEGRLQAQLSELNQAAASALQREQTRRLLQQQFATKEAYHAAAAERAQRLEAEVSEAASRGGDKEDAGRVAVTDAEVLVASTEQAHREAQAAVVAVDGRIDTAGGAEFQDLRREVAALEAQRREQEGRVAEARREVKRSSTIRDRRAAAVAEAQAAAAASGEEELRRQRGEVARLAEAVEALNRKIQQARADSADAQDKAEAAKGRLAAVAGRLRDIADEAAGCAQRKAAVESEMADTVAKIRKIAQRIEEATAKARQNVQDFGFVTWRPRIAPARGADDDSDADAAETGASASPMAAGRKRGRDGRLVEPAGGESDDDEWAVRDVDDDIDLETITTEVPEADLERYEETRTKLMAGELSREVERLKESINLHDVARWRAKHEQFRAERGRYEALLRDLAEAEGQTERLREERRAKFMAVFSCIQTHLKEMYQLLAAGGDAEIELLDSSDPFEGINFVVRPPKKSWKPIGHLSGGEKTLSSLALVFALHHVKPTPVYVMDEIDAALDFRNVSIVARYVLERARGAQFIIISLRNNMFELAHQLVGICKVRDCTRSIVLNPGSVAVHIANRLAAQECAKRERAEAAAAAAAGATPPVALRRTTRPALTAPVRDL